MFVVHAMDTEHLGVDASATDAPVEVDAGSGAVVAPEIELAEDLLARDERHGCYSWGWGVVLSASSFKILGCAPSE